jgi:hypothetical protein
MTKGINLPPNAGNSAEGFAKEAARDVEGSARPDGQLN